MPPRRLPDPGSRTAQVAPPWCILPSCTVGDKKAGLERSNRYQPLVAAACCAEVLCASEVPVEWSLEWESKRIPWDDFVESRRLPDGTTERVFTQVRATKSFRWKHLAELVLAVPMDGRDLFRIVLPKTRTLLMGRGRRGDWSALRSASGPDAPCLRLLPTPSSSRNSGGDARPMVHRQTRSSPDSESTTSASMTPSAPQRSIACGPGIGLQSRTSSNDSSRPSTDCVNVKGRGC